MSQMSQSHRAFEFIQSNWFTPELISSTVTLHIHYSKISHGNIKYKIGHGVLKTHKTKKHKRFIWTKRVCSIS